MYSVYNLLAFRFSDSEIETGLDYVNSWVRWLSQVFIFIDLTATNIYRLLKRRISDSIHPDDSTFPGKFSSVMKFPFYPPQS